MRATMTTPGPHPLAPALLVVAALVGDAGYAQDEDVSPCSAEQYLPPANDAAREALRTGLEEDLQTAVWAGDQDLVLGLMCQGAAAGVGQAEGVLGWLSLGGRLGLRADPAAGRRWLARACDHGFADACLLVAGMYLQGRGGPVRAPEGMALIRQAALGGSRDAMALLAAELVSGEHTPRDLEAAQRWAERAAAAGSPEGAKLLELIERVQEGR